MNSFQHYLACLAALLAASPLAAQINQPAAIPSDIVHAELLNLTAERAVVDDQYQRLLSLISSHNSQCSQVRSDDSASISHCQSSQAQLLSELALYRAALASYESHLDSAPRRQYRTSGNGLVGGTAWQVGYNVPANAPPEVKARAMEMVRQQARAANMPYDQQVDFERYNFVIGIANETVIWRDLASRVIWEQLRNGQATAQNQAAYNSLKDRQFNELGCHSNGAMICLAALENDDVKADDVILYGPQITPESLDMWNKLLEDGKIRTLRIVVSENDPVPPAALLATPQSLAEPIAATLVAPLLFNVDKLTSGIKAISPLAEVTSFPCDRVGPSLDCHDMARYSAFMKSHQ